MNDPAVLVAAAVGAGIAKGTAEEFVRKQSLHRDETSRELKYGRELGVTGVPHFVVSGAKGEVELGGAQPAARFTAAFAKVSG